MADPRVETVARILVDYSVDIQPGELVLMQGAPEGAPLILAVYQRVLERGGHPWLRIDLDEATEVFYKHASDAQLDFVSNIERQFVGEIDASIGIWTQTNELSRRRVFCRTG